MTNEIYEDLKKILGKTKWMKDSYNYDDFIIFYENLVQFIDRNIRTTAQLDDWDLFIEELER